MGTHSGAAAVGNSVPVSRTREHGTATLGRTSKGGDHRSPITCSRPRSPLKEKRPNRCQRLKCPLAEERTKGATYPRTLLGREQEPSADSGMAWMNLGRHTRKPDERGRAADANIHANRSEAERPQRQGRQGAAGLGANGMAAWGDGGSLPGDGEHVLARDKGGGHTAPPTYPIPLSWTLFGG